MYVVNWLQGVQLISILHYLSSYSLTLKSNLIKIARYRGYQMSVGLILNLLNKLNKSILCEPLASILFYSTSSINLVMNLHKFNILFITYFQNELLIVKNDHISPTPHNVTRVFDTVFYSANDVTSKCYYTYIKWLYYTPAQCFMW